jgi:hypothetical protein
MSENVPFFEHMHSKFAKTANIPPNNFALQIFSRQSKNEEFYADSKFVEMGS